MVGKTSRAGGGGKQKDKDLNSYEAERNAMLEENRKRMLELGLLEAANSWSTSSSKAARPVKQKLTRSPLDPVRRSSRLQGTTTVSYKTKPQFARYATKLKNVPHYSGPVRRSSRLQATTTVSYKEQLDDTVVLSHWLSESESESEED